MKPSSCIALMVVGCLLAQTLQASPEWFPRKAVSVPKTSVHFSSQALVLKNVFAFPLSNQAPRWRRVASALKRRTWQVAAAPLTSSAFTPTHRFLPVQDHFYLGLVSTLVLSASVGLHAIFLRALLDSNRDNRLSPLVKAFLSFIVLGSVDILIGYFAFSQLQLAHLGLRVSQSLIGMTVIGLWTVQTMLIRSPRSPTEDSPENSMVRRGLGIGVLMALCLIWVIEIGKSVSIGPAFMALGPLFMLAAMSTPSEDEARRQAVLEKLNGLVLGDWTPSMEQIPTVRRRSTASYRVALRPSLLVGTTKNHPFAFDMVLLDALRPTDTQESIVLKRHAVVGYWEPAHSKTKRVPFRAPYIVLTSLDFSDLPFQGITLPQHEFSVRVLRSIREALPSSVVAVRDVTSPWTPELAYAFGSLDAGPMTKETFSKRLMKLKYKNGTIKANFLHQQNKIVRSFLATPLGQAFQDAGYPAFHFDAVPLGPSEIEVAVFAEPSVFNRRSAELLRRLQASSAFKDIQDRNDLKRFIDWFIATSEPRPPSVISYGLLEGWDNVRTAGFLNKKVSTVKNQMRVLYRLLRRLYDDRAHETSTLNQAA